MTSETSFFATRLARDEADLLAAQRLRYDIFVRELGGDGDLVDHAEGLERDAFDPVVDHLILTDSRRPAGHHVVGVYRLLPGERAAAFGRFYCDDEYDLTPLRTSGRRLGGYAGAGFLGRGEEASRHVHDVAAFVGTRHGASIGGYPLLPEAGRAAPAHPSHALGAVTPEYEDGD